MSGPSPNLALIRRVVLEIVGMVDAFPCSVSTDQMIAVVDRLAVVADHKVEEMASVVQSGWTYMQVIADTTAIVVQQELGFPVAVAVQH